MSTLAPHGSLGLSWPVQAGDVGLWERKFSMQDIQQFARATGDLNPLHLDEEAGKRSRFGKCIAHGCVAVARVFVDGLPG
jgi:3-hydroxybutyryl-CoA dehydratase